MLINSLKWSEILRDLSPYSRLDSFFFFPNEIEPLPNNQYTENYAWMYAIEKRILRVIEGELTLKLPYEQIKLLFGVGGCFSEGLSNAFVHGNQKNPQWPISVGVLIAKGGLGFTIKDSGAGFDVQDVNYRFRHGQPFFLIAGNGFKHFDRRSNPLVGFSEGGSRFNIRFFLDVQSSAQVETG